MKKINILNKHTDILENGYLSFISAFLSLVVLPVHVQYLPPFMILWLLFWIIENKSRFHLLFVTRSAYTVLFVLFVSFYLWEAVSLIYSSNIRLGLLNLYGRLSLLLFPLVLLSPGKIIQERSKLLTRVFALSTSLFMLFCFSYAIVRSVNIQNGFWTFDPVPSEYPWLNYFYSSYLSVNQHPSYIAVYVLLSVIISLEAWFDNSKNIILRYGWLILSIFLLVSLYFLSSRAGIIISLVLVSLYFVIKFIERRQKKFTLIWAIGIGLLIILIAFNNQKLNNISSLLFSKQANDKTERDPRLVIWKSALKISSKNLFLGVGIGDVRTELTREYYKIGESKMAEERLNAHNQFLEVLLENGIVGLILFISIFICMAYIACSDKNLIYGLFMLMLIMFFLFESILYRLAGVSFFSLFSFLLLHVRTNKKTSV